MKIMERTRILQQIANNNYLPSLSPLTVQLIDLAADENSSILDLTRIIEQDPGLTARLLKIVNSVSYAHREPISSISYAVMMAGFKKIRMMALNISLKDTFPLGSVKGMDYDYFWKTSLYRAILAQGLAKGSSLSTMLDPEEVFTAGLILELGLLLLFHICPDTLKESFPGGETPLENVILWEEENIGINHRELGRLTLRHWHFPESIIEAQKTFGPQAFKEGSSDLGRLLEISRVCTQLFLGAEEDFALLKEIARLLKIDLDRLSEILSEVFFKVEEMARELRLQVNSNKDLLEVMEKANRALIKINGSLEENLGKIFDMYAKEAQLASANLREPNRDDKKNLEKAMDAVAHEIRNPLMVIGGFAQRLVKKSEEQANVVKYAELIARESHRLEEVLKEILIYSNPYEPAFKTQNLAAVLEAAVSDLERTTPGQLTIKKTFQSPTLSLPLDREGFQKSLFQILETVSGLTEKSHLLRPLFLEINPEPTQVWITIRFEGAPIPEEVTDILLGRDFSNRTFGKGLGLSWARKILEAHRGRIETARENNENRISIILSRSTRL
jgi:HD-like signal output (HDOD) protein